MKDQRGAICLEKRWQTGRIIASRKRPFVAALNEVKGLGGAVGSFAALRTAKESRFAAAQNDNRYAAKPKIHKLSE